MKKIISIGIICAIVFLPGNIFSFLKNSITSIADNISKTNYTFLLCGYDEAAHNTDSIIVANYDRDSECVSFLQIPRDTYYNFSSGYNKINQYVPNMVASGETISDAMQSFTDEISKALGIKIDGYAGYTMEAMANIIDDLGGIDVNLPISVSGIDLNGEKVILNKGKNHLSGNEAIIFVRYR